jgi:copper resistance protein B
MTRRLLIRAGVAAVSLLALASPVRAQDPHPGQQQKPTEQQPAAQPTVADEHQHHAPAGQKPPLPPFIPPVTDEDRRAAFPDLGGHAVHDNAINFFVLVDQLEWQGGHDASGMNVDSRGWVGRDRDRLWFRAEGSGEKGSVDRAETHLLYGRQFSRWWDVVAGIRQDVRPGSPQTWAAIGVQGLAPYWFEVEATAYVGAAGRTAARFEVEYELRVTNRLVTQPLFEIEIAGKADPERGVGAGLSTTDIGLRLRYEIRREFAPYVGVTWANTWGETADLAEAEGRNRGGARLVAGLRVWF